MQSSPESAVEAETIQPVLIPRVKIHDDSHVSIMQSCVKIELGLMERKERWHGRYKRNEWDQKQRETREEGSRWNVFQLFP